MAEIVAVVESAGLLVPTSEITLQNSRKLTLWIERRFEKGIVRIR